MKSMGAVCVLLLLLTTACVEQSQHTRSMDCNDRLDSVVEYQIEKLAGLVDTLPYFKEVNLYDSTGNKLQESSFVYQDTLAWIETSRITRKFDDLGRETEYVEHAIRDGQLVLQYMQRNVYTEGDEILQIESFAYDRDSADKGWIWTSMGTRRYDSMGRIVYDLFRTLYGGRYFWKPYMETWRYNRKGMLVKHCNYRVSHDMPQLHRATAFPEENTYVVQGDTLSFTWSMRCDTMAYDAAGRVMFHVHYNEAGEPVARDSITYGDGGARVTTFGQRYNRGLGRWEPESKEEVIHDDAGRLSLIHRKAPEATESQERFGYDVHGNMQLHEQMSKAGRDTAWSIVRQFHQYTYDSMGRVLEKSHTALHNNDSVVMDYRAVYNERGLQVSETDKDGLLWHFTHDACGQVQRATAANTIRYYYYSSRK